MYAREPGWGFEFVTSRIRTVGNASTHLYSQDTDTAGAVGAARVAAYRALPALLREFGIEPLTVLDAAGVRADVFDDPENLVPYPVLGRLLSLSAQYTNCDHIGLLLGQRSGLATMGLTGEIAFCADTAGEGLRKFAGFFTLQNTAATVSLISGAGFSRLVYAIAEPGMSDTGQLQLGAMALGFNILQELCGLRWRPTVVTFASLAPSNLRPCQKFFRCTAALRQCRVIDRIRKPLAGPATATGRPSPKRGGSRPRCRRERKRSWLTSRKPCASSCASN